MHGTSYLDNIVCTAHPTLTTLWGTAHPTLTTLWYTLHQLYDSMTLTAMSAMILVVSRVDKQECATPDLFCTICRYPRPRRNFLLMSPFFFRRTRILPQSSVRARAGDRLCNVKPGQVHEAKFSKRLAARASSKRLRQQKIPPRANPSRSCTLLFIYSWLSV